MPDFINNADTIAAFLFGLGACLWIYNGIMRAFGKDRNPQPFSVEAVKRFVERSDYEKDHGLLDARLTGATRSRKEIHEDVEKQASRISRLEAQSKAQTDAANLLGADFREFAREQRAVNKELLKGLRSHD